MFKSDDSPLISIVVPTYERSKYLRGAIETAVEQTYENIEVIVVDDGSTEEYAEAIVSEFSENVDYIRHDENQGLSAARNTGVRESKGEYIAFLDDDDRWHKSKLDRQLSALSTNQEAGLVTCLVAAITPQGEVVHCERTAPSGDCSKAILVSNYIGTPSRVLVRRDVFDEVGGFDESLPTKQDWDFYIRLCQNWHVVAVKDHLCLRTIHESMSNSPEDLKRDKKMILQKHRELIQREGLWSKACADVNAEIGRAYLACGELSIARTFLKKSLAEFSVRRAVLFVLSFTHFKIIQAIIAMKRKLATWNSDCGNWEKLQKEVPGI